MAALPGRHRASSGQDPLRDENLSPTSSSALERIRNLLSLLALEELGRDADSCNHYADVQCDRLRELHVILIDTSHRFGRVKDDFRRLGGFDALLVVTGNLAGLLRILGPLRSVFELLKTALNVLSEALSDNDRNWSFFANSGDKRRWHILEDNLTSLQRALVSGSGFDVKSARRLFDLLFAFALREEGESSVMKIHSISKENPDRLATNVSAKAASGSDTLLEGRRADADVILWIPESILIIVHLWRAQLNLIGKDVTNGDHRELHMSVLSALTLILYTSHFNAVSLHEFGILQGFLEILFSSHLSPEEYDSLLGLSSELLRLGLNSSDLARELFKLSFHTNQAAELVSDVAISRPEPPHFVFDLSLHGHASLELAAIRGSFPPSERTGGYTFMTWFRIDEYDTKCHTTIFGAFDQTQTCFLLLYLERETKQLVLQTSISPERPSVRFKSATFSPGRWYHLAVIQQVPRVDGVSRVTMLIDGEFSERVKCRYPQRPPSSTSNGNPDAKYPTSSKSEAVIQAFIGTPKGLTPRLGTRVLHSRWSLASCQLILAAIPEDLVFVYKNLGPTYVGNFQDSLGSFQTYKTSTALNIRNEYTHSGNAERSVIAKAIKSQAKNVNEQQNFALNIIAASVPSNEFRRIISSSESFRENLHGELGLLSRYSKNERSISPYNLAVVRVRDTSSKLAGLAMALGGTQLSSSRSIDYFTWQLCGSVSFAVKILDKASTQLEITRSMLFVFSLVRDNWRISEAFERENVFSIIAWILRSKAAFRRKAINEHSANEPTSEPFSLRVLRLILDQLGYDEKNPSHAVISNPLAYRALVVDSDIWRSLEGATQELYYKQFVDIVTNSQFSQFNIKRLVRMRVLKRLINALKSESVDRKGLGYMLYALKQFLVCMPSSETYRSVALYITYAVSFRQAASSAMAGSNEQRRPSAGGMSHTLRKATSTRSFSDSSKTLVSDQRLSSLELGSNVLNTLSDLLYEDSSGTHIRKFARTVTNKWLLYLMSTENPDILRPCIRLLSRLLVLHGSSYVVKFNDATHGFLILKKKLNKWCSLDVVWNCSFSIIFGIDPLELSPIDHFNGPRIIALLAERKVENLYCPEMFSVIAAMLEYALRATANPRSPTSTQEPKAVYSYQNSPHNPQSDSHDQRHLIREVCIFLRKTHDILPCFRAFCVDSAFARDIMRALFARYSNVAESSMSPIEGRPVPDILSIDETNGSTESSVANFQLSPDTLSSQGGPPSSSRPRRRHSSFVLVPRNESLRTLTSFSEDLQPPLIEDPEHSQRLHVDETFNSVVEFLVDGFADHIIFRRDFTGLGLFFRAPPCAYDQRAAVNSHLILMTMQRLQNELKLRPTQFHEPTILTNIARFSQQTFEAYMEGWFIYGARPIVDFNIVFLQYLNQPSVQALKEIRLCSPAIATIQSTLGKSSLFHITSSSDVRRGLDRVNDLLAVDYWEELISAGTAPEETFFGPLSCALLRLVPEIEEDDLEILPSLLRHFINQKPEEFVGSFIGEDQSSDASTFNDFLLVLLNEKALLHDWLSSNLEPFRRLVTNAKNRILMPFIAEEERLAAKAAETRSTRRKERLEQWHLEDLATSHTWTEHKISAKNWTDNIINAELHKYYRYLQDQQESFEHLKFHFEKLTEVLRTLNLIGNDSRTLRWQLDECEGRDRMRLRLSPVFDIEEKGYEPKQTRSMRRASQRQSTSGVNLNAPRKYSATTKEPRSRTESIPQAESPQAMESSKSSFDINRDGFEMITEPNLDEEEEDKNRKVMRSLQRGEQVLNAFNMSRIVGLEAHEGLLIIGKTSLYLIDGLFQRSDGEVVNVNHAPIDERDQYTKVMSGHEVDLQNVTRRKQEPTRHWLWSDILSFSKRNFLTRAVAVEIFFTDGRSYLLTASKEEQRDVLYSDLAKNTSQARTDVPLDNEESWRAELLKNPGEGSSRFSQLLGPMISNPMTKRWIKGDVSNFHYLMWVNSQAGRTFNDLTQYPVFPWVIADYTSDELDLSNPRSFRDLTKPMGCQQIERSESFRERYASLAEMDEQTPPFHYGTHYSSAMIVTSFLIRLQPFAQSHVLLQGGSFDHANRLFHSVEQAWRSASREGLSDVRELIPEFYCLPDFLRNVNQYNFGFREGDNENVDDVKLPPWAKGDAEIFISKHREALESQYVSQNLHAWIDLIFGFKQRGEAAVEATNVFHYLSYPGAKDLDKIQDQHERAATIGIIHNFGQTPRQIFLRPHDRRDQAPSKGFELLERMRSLARLRAPIQELTKAVTSFYYSRHLIPSVSGSCVVPGQSIVADWAYPDQSLRFWSSDGRKMLALYEQLHDKSILSAMFAGPATFVTGAEDGTVSAWKSRVSSDSVEIHPRATLFGHRSGISVLAISKAYSVLLTGSMDGVIILWDLNRLERIREIDCGRGIQDARISEGSGRVLVSAGAGIQIYTLNGRRLVDQKVCDSDDDVVTSCNFHQQSTNAWYETEVILTGHKKGIIKVWNVAITGDGSWSLALLNKLNVEGYIKGQSHPNITALLAVEQKVWAGDDQGRVFEWNAVR